MHKNTLSKLEHEHNFSLVNEKGEKKTRYVLILTAVTMLVEVTAGTYYGSMALLADGWHMGTHVAAFLLALFSYSYARKHAENPDFSFGTGKVNVLGGFASAIGLGIVALIMILESVLRIVDPQEIRFDEAIIVASAGLFINLVSAILLKDEHHHHHEEDDHHHHDHNLRAAYLHVLADALTSVLAIIALVCGKFWGLSWMDPIMGIVGALIIARWSLGLIRETSPVLLDAGVEQKEREEIKALIEQDSDNRIADLHVWRLGPNHKAAIISLVTHFPKPADHYRNLLKKQGLSHISIEVNICENRE